MNPSSSVVWGARPFQAPGSVGKAVRLLLVIEAILGVVSSVATFIASRGDTFMRFPGIVPGIRQRISPFGFYPQPMGTVVWIASLVSTGTVICWLIWQHRAQANVWAIPSPVKPDITPGWAVGWWFVPVANLVMPFLAVRELSRRSADATGSQRSALILWTWWLCWVGALVIAAIGSVSTLGAFFSRFADAIDASTGAVEAIVVPMDAVRTGVQLLAFGYLVRAVAACLAYAVVTGIERDQTVIANAPPVIPARPDVVLSS